MYVIGVTGGIGSGKSTVSSILARYGAKIIDADLLAREVVLKGSKALDELVNCFGSEILDEDGRLDRRKLGELAFNDKDKLKALNEITHRYIVEKMLDDLEKLESDGTRLAVIDAPLPVEHGFLDVVDEVWVVTADVELRLKRVMERSGLSREEALSRIDSQISEEEYEKVADIIILNNSNADQLENRIAGLIKERMKEL